MLTFVILYLFSIAIFLIESVDKKTAYFASVIFFIFVVCVLGLKGSSFDYDTYLDIFSRVSFDGFGVPLYSSKLGTSGNEFIFATMISSLKLISDSSIYLFSVIAFLSVGIKLVMFSKYSESVGLSLVVFMSYMFFKDLGQIRNALAAAVILLSVRPLVERNFSHFFLICVIAGGIQIYALTTFAVYFFHHFINRKRNMWLVLVICLFIALMGGAARHLINIADTLSGDVVTKVVNYFYKEENLQLSFLSIQQIIFLSFAVAFAMYKDELSKHNVYYSGFVSLFLWGTCVNYVLFDFSVLAGRTVEMFSFNSLSILVPSLLLLFKKSSFYIVLLVILVYFSLLFLTVAERTPDYKVALF